MINRLKFVSKRKEAHRPTKTCTIHGELHIESTDNNEKYAYAKQDMQQNRKYNAYVCTIAVCCNIWETSHEKWEYIKILTSHNYVVRVSILLDRNLDDNNLYA